MDFCNLSQHILSSQFLDFIPFPEVVGMLQLNAKARKRPPLISSPYKIHKSLYKLLVITLCVIPISAVFPNPIPSETYNITRRMTAFHTKHLRRQVALVLPDHPLASQILPWTQEWLLPFLQWESLTLFHGNPSGATTPALCPSLRSKSMSQPSSEL